ncbi:MAG: hypothetical protein GWN58_24430 [Anaerolineae bacterium]|nr:hypothetical protein [Anaerolineae bacterium]
MLVKRTLLQGPRAREETYHASPMASIVHLAQLESDLGLVPVNAHVYRCAVTDEIVVIVDEDLEEADSG